MFLKPVYIFSTRLFTQCQIKGEFHIIPLKLIEYEHCFFAAGDHFTQCKIKFQMYVIWFYLNSMFLFKMILYV